MLQRRFLTLQFSIVLGLAILLASTWIAFPFARTEYNIFRGVYAFNLGDFDSAVDYLDASAGELDRRGDNVRSAKVRRLLAQSHLALGHRSQAVVQYATLIDQHQADGMALLIAGLDAMSKADWARAKSHIEAASELEPACDICKQIRDDIGTAVVATDQLLQAHADSSEAGGVIKQSASCVGQTAANETVGRVFKLAGTKVVGFAAQHIPFDKLAGYFTWWAKIPSSKALDSLGEQALAEAGLATCAEKDYSLGSDRLQVFNTTARWVNGLPYLGEVKAGVDTVIDVGRMGASAATLVRSHFTAADASANLQTAVDDTATFWHDLEVQARNPKLAEAGIGTLRRIASAKDTVPQTDYWLSLRHMLPF